MRECARETKERMRMRRWFGSAKGVVAVVVVAKRRSRVFQGVAREGKKRA